MLQMANRAADWMRQARADLAMARNAEQSGNYEWSSFAAQQAAEKALKSVGLSRGIDLWGHSVAALLLQIDPDLEPDTPLVDAAKQLDHHYIPARYPNGLPAGAPVDLYTRNQATQAILHAEQILDWCESHS